MGSRTKFFGTVLAMLAANSIYMQSRQVTTPPEPQPQSSPSPQSVVPQSFLPSPQEWLAHLLAMIS
jgi:hypothetical protein